MGSSIPQTHKFFATIVLADKPNQREQTPVGSKIVWKKFIGICAKIYKKMIFSALLVIFSIKIISLRHIKNNEISWNYLNIFPNLDSLLRNIYSANQFLFPIFSCHFPIYFFRPFILCIICSVKTQNILLLQR